MVAILLTIDVLHCIKAGLNLNEYLTLLKLKEDKGGEKILFIPDDRFFPHLLELGYIEEHEGVISLSEKGLAFFGTEDLFEEFYRTFPNKVPTSTGFRPVSTLDPESNSAAVTKSIWKRMTHGKPSLQRKVIDNLKKELSHRKADGSLAYLQNIDTWLRQATWEKWDDIPERNNPSTSIKL